MNKTAQEARQMNRQKNTRYLEDEASYFAMCLLMPERLVKSEIEKMGRIDLADDNLLKHLAKIFDVPLNAMAVRLAQIYPTKKLLEE